MVVTGAGGLLGSHLTPLLAESRTVYATGRNFPEGWNQNVVPIKLDLSRPLHGQYLPERTDAVVYIAQSNRFREFPEAAEDIFQVNTVGVASMLSYARSAGVTHFVYASTGGVYSPSPTAITEETHPAAFTDLGFYAGTKLCAEILVSAYAGLMTVVILRFFFIYGAGQKRTMLIPRVIDSVLSGTPITLQGEEGLRFNPIHVSDAARAVESALFLRSGGTFNIAGLETLSLRRVASMIGKLAGRDPVFEFREAARPGDLIADTTRMRRELAEPSRSFEVGVRDLMPGAAVQP